MPSWYTIAIVAAVAVLLVAWVIIMRAGVADYIRMGKELRRLKQVTSSQESGDS